MTFARISLLSVVLSLFLVSGAIAKTVSELQLQAKNLQLGSHPEWLNLLHYKPTSGGFISYVDDDYFFYSKDGKINSESELMATLSAFFRSVDKADDNHALCRFPARFIWLKNHLGIDTIDLSDVECRQYFDWKNMVQAKKAALIFPAYYLNSPSSMFGHTLLRLDAADTERSSEWLSFAVNFGAETREEDNSIMYAFKGLAGGYSGLFNVMPYFRKIQEYNTIENRDIWEYSLNLSSVEVERMVAHLWELKEIKFDYYFFNENCSFRLLELLEVARPGVELTDKFGLTAIPVDTVRAIVNAGLTDKVKYRPSQAAVLKDRLEKISNKHRTLVKNISMNPGLVETLAFESLSPIQQKNILDASYKYLRFRQTKKARNNKAARNSYRLLKLINQFPQDTVKNIMVPTQPNKGHFTRRWSIGGGQRDEQFYIDTGLRMAFHSLGDREDGFLRGAQINMFNLEVGMDEDNDVYIKQLDFIDIFSLTPRDEFFKPLSWKVYTGLEQRFVKGRNRTVAHVSGGAGASYSVVDSGMVYALGTGRLEHNSAFKNGLSIALGASLGAVYYSGVGVSKLDVSGLKFENSEERGTIEMTQNIVLARNHALEFSFQREWFKDKAFNEATIQYHYYYD